jgi:hypothetical protein
MNIHNRSVFLVFWVYSLLTKSLQIDLSKVTALNEAIQCWQQKGQWLKKGLHSMYRKPCVSYVSYVSDRCLLQNRESYSWRVRRLECPIDYKFWDARMLCELLKDEVLMIVGDSMNEEFYFTLMSALGAPTCQPSPQVEVQCSETSQFHVQFIRNDNLSIRSDLALTYPESDCEHPWITFINGSSERPSVRPATMLFINKGAHFRPDEEFIAGIQLLIIISR